MNDPDTRIPVFAGDPGRAAAGDAVVGEGGAEPPLHGVGCACCAPRPALARTLARLFVDRARGATAFFTRVIVACPPGGEAALAAAIAADPVSAARFRFAGRLAQTAPDSSPSPSARCM
jgi:hypothetical protein